MTTHKSCCRFETIIAPHQCQHCGEEVDNQGTHGLNCQHSITHVCPSTLASLLLRKKRFPVCNAWTDLLFYACSN